MQDCICMVKYPVGGTNEQSQVFIRYRETIISTYRAGASVFVSTACAMKKATIGRKPRHSKVTTITLRVLLIPEF